MSTLLALVIALVLHYMRKDYKETFAKGQQTIEHAVGYVLAFSLFFVLFVWVVGWLVLPSWGIGSITTCYGPGCYTVLR